MTLYDEIGLGYRRRRREDPRIAARIHAALGDAASVVNVGAGAGSYEPRDRRLVAVEPSRVMIRQRDPGSPVVRASANDLPFADASFDASLAVLTIHHWPDLARGLGELRRVARRRVVVLTHDASVAVFWLLDYFPGLLGNGGDLLPRVSEVQRHLGRATVETIPVPHDCVDGFLGAYWRRPEAYLDADVRAAISSLCQVPDAAPGLVRLRDDLRSGRWRERYGALLGLAELDLGYRLLVAAPA